MYLLSWHFRAISLWRVNILNLYGLDYIYININLCNFYRICCEASFCSFCEKLLVCCTKFTLVINKLKINLVYRYNYKGLFLLLYVFSYMKLNYFSKKIFHFKNKNILFYHYKQISFYNHKKKASVDLKMKKRVHFLILWILA